MKRTLQVMLLGLLLLGACRGRDGAPGPRGSTGSQGNPGPEAFVFEFENIDFDTSNNFEVFVPFPNGFRMLNSDKLLVYFLWGFDEDIQLDIWRLLPQTVFTDSGLVAYNYDFTEVDARLFMEGNVRLDSLNDQFTKDWIVRLVVVPGFFARGVEGPNYENYHEVAALYKLDKPQIKDRDQKRPTRFLK